MKKLFSQSEIEAIAAALADTTDGLTGSEIARILHLTKMTDPNPSMTKRHRLANAFIESQNKTQDRIPILAFIKKAMKPERYIKNPERFETLRFNLNKALAFMGIEMLANGSLNETDIIDNISEAEQRAHELKKILISRDVHPDVLNCCRAELVDNNYFHAVLEATKSIFVKLRSRTGLTDDGATLVDRTLTGEIPMLAINDLSTESLKSEQKGFANLVKGVFGMFRNTTAHEAKILWRPILMKDAEDLLSLASLIHRRLDSAIMPSRV